MNFLDERNKNINEKAKKVEYWQCGHTRKCKWIGTYDELESVKSTEYPDIDATDSVCPNCGNKEFYVLNDEEYFKIIKRKTK